jgi:hypothetical protein
MFGRLRCGLGRLRRRVFVWRRGGSPFLVFGPCRACPSRGFCLGLRPLRFWGCARCCLWWARWGWLFRLAVALGLAPRSGLAGAPRAVRRPRRW